MNILHKYTDEELLAYLMGEGEQEMRAVLARDLENDPELSERLATLVKIRTRLQQLPLETFYTARRPVSASSLFIRAVIITVIFFIGAMAQAEFSILNTRQDISVTVKSTSSGGDFPFSSRVVM